MLIFAVFTLGYFAGVFTALFVFPPKTNELREQEIDAMAPLTDMSKDNRQEEVALDGLLDNPAIASN